MKSDHAIDLTIDGVTVQTPEFMFCAVKLEPAKDNSYN